MSSTLNMKTYMYMYMYCISNFLYSDSALSKNFKSCVLLVNNNMRNAVYANNE